MLKAEFIKLKDGETYHSEIAYLYVNRADIYIEFLCESIPMDKIECIDDEKIYMVNSNDKYIVVVKNLCYQLDYPDMIRLVSCDGPRKVNINKLLYGEVWFDYFDDIIKSNLLKLKERIVSNGE